MAEENHTGLWDGVEREQLFSYEACDRKLMAGREIDRMMIWGSEFICFDSLPSRKGQPSADAKKYPFWCAQPRRVCVFVSSALFLCLMHCTLWASSLYKHRNHTWAPFRAGVTPLDSQIHGSSRPSINDHVHLTRTRTSLARLRAREAPTVASVCDGPIHSCRPINLFEELEAVFDALAPLDGHARRLDHRRPLARKQLVHLSRHVPRK